MLKEEDGKSSQQLVGERVAEAVRVTLIFNGLEMGAQELDDRLKIQTLQWSHAQEDNKAQELFIDLSFLRLFPS